MKRYSILLAASLLALLWVHPATGQVRTERFDISAMADNTVTYILPETALYAVFGVEERHEEPGEFALYAMRYLGVKDAVMKEKHTFVLRDITAGTYGVPSDTLKFSTRFSRRNTGTNVTLSPDGILLGINAPTVVLPALPESKISKLPADGAFEALTGMPREYVQATTVAKKAQIAADEIFRLRDSRTAVISGQSEQPFVDGEAMKVAVSGLDKAERALTERFTGSVRTAEQTFVLSGIPLARGEEIIARFSEQYGLLDKGDLRGSPVYLTVKVTEQSPVLDEKDRRKKERQLSRGIVYTMPGRVSVEISYEGKVLFRSDYPAAQYGHQEALEEVLFTDRDKMTEIIFDPATGGILKVGTL